MSCGILITARLSSVRLKQKHLLLVNNKELINYLIDRIKAEFRKEIEEDLLKIIIATGNENENNLFEEKCNTHVYYGNNDNIPKRHLEAAIKHKLKYIISVDGDDILCSSYAMRKVWESLYEGKKMVKTVGLPLGMNVMGYSTDYLNNCLMSNEYDVLETGWGRIFKESDIHNIEINSENDERYRFTLDYEDDLKFFNQTILLLKNKISIVSDNELIESVRENELFKINGHLNTEYWSNFNRSVSEEENNND